MDTVFKKVTIERIALVIKQNLRPGDLEGKDRKIKEIQKRGKWGVKRVWWRRRGVGRGGCCHLANLIIAVRISPPPLPGRLSNFVPKFSGGKFYSPSFSETRCSQQMVTREQSQQ